MKRGLAVLALVAALTGVVALRPAHKAEAAGLSSTFVCNAATGATCTVNITGFQVVGGVLQAVGTITNNATGQVQNFVADVTAHGSCKILHLEVGPIDLNLLGLQVKTNQIVVDITAQAGPGNLLGNLLCSVAHLLDANGLSQLLPGLLNGTLGGVLQITRIRFV